MYLCPAEVAVIQMQKGALDYYVLLEFCKYFCFLYYLRNDCFFLHRKLEKIRKLSIANKIQIAEQSLDGLVYCLSLT